MKITDVRTTRITVPFAKFGKFAPVAMWYMTRHADYGTTVTFIDTDEGITGVSTRGDADVIMNKIRPKIIGMDPFDIPTIERSERDGGCGVTTQQLGFGTVSAIDCALWDIIGKKVGQPLYKLWGGRHHDVVHVRYWLSCDAPEVMVAEAMKAVERGWRAFKIKLGTHPDLDLERAVAIRDAVGDKIELNFDINGGYSVSRSLRMLPKLMRVDPTTVEEPIANTWPWDYHSIEGMSFLRRTLGVPIEAHCHGPNIEEFVRILGEKEAADTFHTRPGFGGPVLQLKRLCAMADMYGIRSTAQSSAAELGPTNAYILHWVVSSPEFTGTNDSSTHLFEPPSWDIIKDEFKTVNGTLQVPEGPGLGVEICPVKLAKSEKLAKEGKYPPEKGWGQVDKYYWG